MPQARASEVPGIHSQPPERAVVPPKLGSFSTIRTLRPEWAAVIAADMPEAPEPTTTASYSKESSDPFAGLATGLSRLFLQEGALGFGNRTVGVFTLHGLDDLEIIPRLLGLFRSLDLREIHVADDAAVLAQFAAVNEGVLDRQFAHLGHHLRRVVGAGGLDGFEVVQNRTVDAGLD